MIATVVESILDRRESSDDTLEMLVRSCSPAVRDCTHCGVSDLSILHRDIEVNTDEDAFALEIEVCDSEFLRERHP